MSHPEQLAFIDSVRSRYPDMFVGKRILEVGSLDVNGSVRGLFEGCDYTGVDLDAGPCVDVIGQGQSLDYSDESFDVVISAECFEHNPFWLETFVNMRRMASGLVVFTCATTGRGEHGTVRSGPECSPFTVAAGWNYYMNLTAEDFMDALPIDDLFTSYEFTVNESAFDLYFVGTVGEVRP